MQKVIVVVEMPDDQQPWLAFLAASGTVPGNEAIEKLAENVWQIDFQKSPTTFAKLVDAMKRFGLPGKILPLGAESQWLPVDSNPVAR
jgi:hypothetical protein